MRTVNERLSGGNVRALVDADEIGASTVANLLLPDGIQYLVKLYAPIQQQRNIAHH